MRMLSGLVQSSIDEAKNVILSSLQKVCRLSLAYLSENFYLCGTIDNNRWKTTNNRY